MSLKFDEHGLIPAIAQDRLTGEVRMQAWMNAEALEQTLRTGFATFYSRSRQKLWTKGESSGNRLKVSSVTADCDGDTLLLSVDPEGPSCHTGQQNCFFEPVPFDAGSPASEPNQQPILPYLFELERVILARQTSTADKSYTKQLLEGGPDRVNAKILEEAGELTHAIAGESEERVASEAADVLYHLLVGLRVRGVDVRRVVEALYSRSQRSGHEEKANRPRI